jgi:hypothetical protein
LQANQTAVGYRALEAACNATNNTALGYLAGTDLSSGSDNTAIGTCALMTANAGIRNTVVGSEALMCSTGSSNTAIGRESGKKITSGCCNTHVGNAAGAAVSTSTGCCNTSIGATALASLTSGDNNVAVGFYSGTNFGGGAVNGLISLTTQNNHIVMGNDNHVCSIIKTDWTVTSDARDKTCIGNVPHGLAYVNAVCPRSYYFKKDRDSEETEGNIRYGFIAQELAPLEGDKPIVVSAEDADNLKYNDHYMTPILVNAIKELTQKVEMLEAKLKELC